MNPETPLNCEDAQQLSSDAMAGDVDDAALERLDAHLEGCDACKLLSVKLFRQDRALSEMGAGEQVKSLRAKIREHLQLPQQAPKKKKSKVHRFRIRPRVGHGSSFWSITAGIAALLVVGVLVAFYMGKTQNPALAKLSSYDGTPIIFRNGHAIENSVGLELQAGDSIELPAGTHADVTYAFAKEVGSEMYAKDPSKMSTVLTLEPQSSIRLDGSKADPQVFLKSGTLSAKVEHQPPGKHFVVATPRARVEVIGTKFQVSAKPDQTQLLVDEGKVKFSRVSDKAEVDVPAQHYAVARENTPLVALAKLEQLTNPVKEQRKRLITVVEQTSLKSRAADRLEAVKQVVQTFKADTFTKGKAALPYRLFSPEIVMPGTQFPLVIYLHGIGGNGKDNLKQLTDQPFAAGIWALAENQARHPCFVLAPQVTGGFDGPAHQLVLDLIDELLKTKPIDARRVYITGVSSGANGVYWCLQARPKFFAAAVPISGWLPDVKKMNTYAHVPLWIFHGDQDKTINPGNSRKAFDDFSALGADIRFDEYEKAGHDIFAETYNQSELLEWVFARVAAP